MDNPRKDINSLPNIFWVGLIAIVAVISIGTRYTSYYIHDVGWLTYLVGEYLEGSRLYVDLIESNPPLIFFIYMVPVYAAKILSVELRVIFYAYTFALGALSCGISFRLLNNIKSVHRLFFVLLMVVALFILPRGDFGQREHFMVIFALPYIVLAIRRIENQPCNMIAALGIGGLAVLGFGIKPHFLLIPAVLELYFLARTRRLSKSFRPETITLGLGICAYIGAIFLFTPEYFSVIIPFVLEVYGQAFNSPFMDVVFRLELILIILLCVMSGLMIKEGSTLPSAVVVLFLAGCAAFVMYLVQMKGWRYQHYPALAFLFMATGLLVVEWKSHINTPLTRGLAYFMGSIVLIGLPLASVIKYKYYNGFVEALSSEVTAQGPVTSLLVISTNLSAGFPLTNIAGVKWASRFPTMSFLPGIIRRRATSAGKPLPKVDEIEQYNINAVIEDLAKFKPEVVFVDVRKSKPYFGGIAFNYIDYFSKDERFRALWSHYAKTRHAKFGFDTYRLKK